MRRIQSVTFLACLVTDGSQALKMVRSLKPDLFVLDYLLAIHEWP